MKLEPIIPSVEEILEQIEIELPCLLDRFAIAALPVVMQSFYDDGLPVMDGSNASSVAELSYAMASAMLDARCKYLTPPL